MKKHIKQGIMTLERGDAGISYAMYFVAIIMVIVLYVFQKFNADLYVAEEVLENGLHIVENRVMTANQSYLDDEGTRVDQFDKEVKRLHIVTSYDGTTGSLTSNEQLQLKEIGEEFSKVLQEQLLLNGTKPVSGVLKTICSENSDVVISGPVVIYEPIYERTVVKTENGNISGTSIGKYNFESTYTIKGWIQYNLNFSNNNYVGATKSLIDVANTPTFRNSSRIKTEYKSIEGATIEATLAISFNGVRNIFAGISGPTNPGDVDYTNPGHMFSDNPTETQYDVEVTQSTDIVVSSNDQRQK